MQIKEWKQKIAKTKSSVFCDSETSIIELERLEL